MSYQLLAQVKINDALREAEKTRLAKYASKSRNNQVRQHLSKFACQFRLAQTC